MLAFHPFLNLEHDSRIMKCPRRSKQSFKFRFRAEDNTNKLVSYKVKGLLLGHMVTKYHFNKLIPFRHRYNKNKIEERAQFVECVIYS